MILTEEMQKIMNLIQDDENNVFVTGKAGSGKTTFLKYLIEKSGKNCIVAAPTGIAAINAGGVTLHSLFGIPFGPITPYDRLENKFSEYKVELLLKWYVQIFWTPLIVNYGGFTKVMNHLAVYK